MSEYIKRLDEQRKRAWETAKSIMDTAAAEGRDLSAEERATLDKTDSDLDGYKAEIEKVTRMAKVGEAANAFVETVERTAATPEISDGQKLAIMFGGDQRSLADYDKAEGGVAFSQSPAFRALGSAGGSAVPTTFADFVTVYERTLNPVYAVSKVIATTSGNPIVLPRLTADVTAGGSVTAQAGTITEGDPTISSVTLSAFKIAHITLWSKELDQDEVIGLESLVADAIARPIGLGWGTFFTTGTGTTQPFGFVTSATNGGTASGTAGNQASDTFVAATDLIDLFYSLAAPYRQNASWMVASPAKMRKFRDANGQLLWAPGLVAGQPDTFLARPVYENPAMAAVASASKSFAVGDFSRYVIRSVEPMRVDISDQYKFNADQLAIRVVTRRDGALVDADAIKYIVSANT